MDRFHIVTVGLTSRALGIWERHTIFFSFPFVQIAEKNSTIVFSRKKTIIETLKTYKNIRCCIRNTHALALTSFFCNFMQRWKAIIQSIVL